MPGVIASLSPLCLFSHHTDLCRHHFWGNNPYALAPFLPKRAYAKARCHSVPTLRCAVKLSLRALQIQWWPPLLKCWWASESVFMQTSVPPTSSLIKCKKVKGLGAKIPYYDIYHGLTAVFGVWHWAEHFSKDENHLEKVLKGPKCIPNPIKYDIEEKENELGLSLEYVAVVVKPAEGKQVSCLLTVAPRVMTAGGWMLGVCLMVWEWIEWGHGEWRVGGTVWKDHCQWCFGQRWARSVEGWYWRHLLAQISTFLRKGRSPVSYNINRNLAGFFLREKRDLTWQLWGSLRFALPRHLPGKVIFFTGPYYSSVIT